MMISVLNIWSLACVLDVSIFFKIDSQSRLQNNFLGGCLGLGFRVLEAEVLLIHRRNPRIFRKEQDLLVRAEYLNKRNTKNIGRSEDIVGMGLHLTQAFISG